MKEKKEKYMKIKTKNNILVEEGRWQKNDW